MQRLLLAFLLTTITGCATLTAETPRPKMLSLANVSAKEFYNLLKMRRDRMRSIDAFGKVRISSPDNRFKASQVVLAKFPENFRIEVLVPFGVSYTVASNGQSLAALSSQDQILLRGTPNAETVAQVLGIAMDPRELTALLLGHPPVRGDTLQSAWTSRRSPQKTAPKPGEASIFLHGSDEQDTSVVIGFAALTVRRESVIVPVSFQRIARSGESLLRASFAKFIPIAGVLTPLRIRIEAAGNQAFITYSDVEPNKVLSASLFRITPPPGVIEQKIDLTRPQQIDITAQAR